ncbi:uncharacterized protein LOC135085601 [Ostrinia nubilalis]|uniref:uncharacterized protein LOC135085601 n=1 Tax=Ostrinia nubilalis TaxID=29057 RepID=UPI0030823DF7
MNAVCGQLREFNTIYNSIMEDHTIRMENEFGPFHDTYRLNMYSMSYGMIYPNPATNKWRLLAIPILCFTTIPMTVLVFLDIRRYWIDGEILEVIRHVGLIGPFITGILKMCLLYYKEEPTSQILALINKDYASFNQLPESYKPLVRGYVKNTRFYQNIWIACVLMILSTFVLTASVMNICETLFSSEPKRHMIYDVRLPIDRPEAQFETPYFEILYIYMLYIAAVYTINFTGYDGFMIACVYHACLRIELFCKYVHDAMDYEGDELRKRLGEAVNHHCETFKLIEKCESSFNFYLGLVYVIVTTELCICLYLVMEGFEFDYKFSSFSIGTILHIYVPCLVAEKLKSVCENASDLIYCCGWENNYDLSMRKFIPYMMARAQTPVAMKAFGLITFEMSLFASTMKTAYSMYTIIKTQ